jgi:MFS family permease
MRFVAILWLGIVPESLEEINSDPRPLLTQLRSYLHSSSRGTWSDWFKRINPVKLLRILTPANTRITRGTQRNLLALASVNTILFGAVMGGMMVMMLYSEFRFEWDNKDSGIFLSTVNVFRTLATVVVLPLTIKISRRYFGGSASTSTSHAHGHGHGHGGGDHGADCPDTPTGVIEPLDLFLLRASIVSDTIGYLGYALSPTGFLFTLSGAVASLGAIGLATSEAAMTKLLPTSQTGELLGALGLLQAMARIVAPTVASLVYSMTTTTFPQLVFWGIAAMFAVGGFVTVLVRVGDQKGEKEGLEEGEDAIPLREGVGKGFDDD